MIDLVTSLYERLNLFFWSSICSHVLFAFSPPLICSCNHILSSLLTSLQARIQTQESQIIECEAALKCRNEELKSLRIDNVEMGEKCDTLEVSLKDAVESNDDLKKQLLAIQVKEECVLV